jgi:hypothetical protein
VHVGGQFSPMAFLMILNEIAITVSRVLLLAEHFIDVPQDKRSLVEAQARALEGSATGWVRITNYEERLREPSKGHE